MTVLESTPSESWAAIARPFVMPRLWLVLAGFTALSVLFFWPWIAHLSSALIGPPEDNMQDFWNSWHVATATSWHELFFTRKIRFPEGTSLAYHSFAWPQVAAVALLGKLFGTSFSTLVTLQNLTLLASFPLAGVSAFLLARHLLGECEGRDLAAAVAGFIFAFNPWHVAQAMHHAHVATIEFLPLFVLFHLRALERHSWIWSAAAAATLALNALACWYFLFYGLYFMAFHLLALRLQHGLWPRGWALALPVLCAGAAAFLLAPWLIPMAVSGFGTSVYYVGSNMFVADLLGWFAFPPTHLLARWGSSVYAALTGNAWEDTVYLGLVNLALLGWALVTRKTGAQKRLLSYALGGALFFAVIASGEALHVGGHVTWLHLPDNVLDKLPFFANVRTPARAAVLVHLFVGVAVAQAVVMALRYKAVGARAALGMGMVLMLLDFTPAHLATTPAGCPPALSVVAADPAPVGVLDLPAGYGPGNAYMMLAACHGKPIVQGETSRRMGTALADRLQTADLGAQKRQLIAAHVKYVVLHKGAFFPWNHTDGDRAAYPHVYRVIGDTPDLTVLRIY
jgi:hypothetical protein